MTWFDGTSVSIAEVRRESGLFDNVVTPDGDITLAIKTAEIQISDDTSGATYDNTNGRWAKIQTLVKQYSSYVLLQKYCGSTGKNPKAESEFASYTVGIKQLIAAVAGVTVSKKAKTFPSNPDGVKYLINKKVSGFTG